MSKIKVVNMDALSYVGTTWLNLLLGNHPDAMTIGPPHRMWELKDKNFEGACLVHGPSCEFWQGFAKTWDKNENFFEALSQFSRKTIFFMDNAPQEFLDATTNSDNIEVIKGRYLRDGRAITASYARKMQSKGITFQESIRPGGWIYHSFVALPSFSEMKKLYQFVIRYEDAVRDQSAALQTVGAVLGIKYNDSTFRFWEGDHHITVGNQGPISMVRLHQNMNVGNFESRQIYQTQLERLKKDPMSAFSDERWKTQLTTEDLQEFDRLLGWQNKALGYPRDVFEHSIPKKLGSMLSSNLVTLRKFLHPRLNKLFSVKRRLWLRETLKPYLKPALVWFRNKRTQPSSSDLSSEGTHYHDTIDKNKLKALGKYELTSSSLSLEDVYFNVNYNFFSAYGPNFKLKDCLALSVDGPLDYRRLLSELKRRLPNLESNTFAHYLPSKKLQDDEIACIIRHDVDGDLVAATQQAKIEKSLGFKTSYYILHTAPYYGVFQNDGRFERNDECITSYQEIQSLGHEIALHTDGMLVYQEHQRDGAQCLTDEIDWLRNNNIDLVGTTAHNSWPSYGVENFTIFEGKDRGKGAGMRAVSHNGKWAPLGMLSEKAMGLSYEANELFWQTDSPVFYAALRSQNVWRVFYYNYTKEMLVKEYAFGKLADFNNKFVSTDQLLELVETISSPAYLYLVVHPMHYGLRANHDEAPWMPSKAEELTSGGTSKWAGYNKGEEHLVGAISLLNELNTYDRGLDCYKSAAQKILSLGSANIATNQISVDSKYSQVTAQQVSRLSKTPRTAATSYADKSPSLGSFQAAYEKVLKLGKPDYLVIGLDSNNSEFCEIIEWAESVSGQTNRVIVLVEDASKLELQNNSDFSDNIITKIDIFVPDIFNEYNGATSLFRAGNNGIWSPQGHYLVGCEISSQISQFITA